jgi:ATP-dependent phosphoenolpyruvate carboxykinase
MEQLRQWFAERLPSVKTRIARPKETWSDDEQMRAAIRSDGHAAILGVGL